MRSPSSAFSALRATQENQVAGHSLKSEQMYLFILSNLQPTGRAGALSQPLASESWDYERRELLNCFAQFLSLKQLAPRGKSRRRTQLGLTHIWWLEISLPTVPGTQMIQSARQAQAMVPCFLGLLLCKCCLPLPSPNSLKNWLAVRGCSSASYLAGATGEKWEETSSQAKN